MKKILIVADYNDADYAKDVVKVEDEVFNKFLPLIRAINNFSPYVARHKYGEVCDHNWESPRTDLGEKPLYETYPQFSREYIDEFKDVFMGGLHSDGWSSCFHTIVRMEDVITDEVYIDYRQDCNSITKRYDDKVKGFLKERGEWMDKHSRLLHIPCNKLTAEENELIEEFHNIWRKYQ